MKKLVKEFYKTIARNIITDISEGLAKALNFDKVLTETNFKDLLKRKTII